MSFQILKKFYQDRIFPKDFNIDKLNRTVDVTFTDGSVFRVFNVDLQRASFLGPLTTGLQSYAPNFIQYVEAHKRHYPMCKARGGVGSFWNCCPHAGFDVRIEELPHE